MADITVTAANARPVVVGHSFPGVALAALDAMTPVYIDGTTGKVAAADASAAGTSGVVGLAAKAVAAGEGVTVLGNGSIVAGHVLTALNYGDRLYLSDTAGKVASTSAEGTTKVTVGRVIAGLASTTYDKLVLVEIEHVVTTG